MSIDIAAAKARFEAEFGAAPEAVVRAPGRVNIIGEHTDYNHGFVLPMAIEREAVILGKKRNDQYINAFAANMDRRTEADLNNLVRNPEDSWIDYIAGVALEVQKLDYPLSGVDLMIIGDVPLGCGLSSSAALEMAALCLFESLDGFSIAGPDAARLGQRVENSFLGLSTGIMDQFISRCGKADHALFLDCRTFQHELIPVDFPDALFVIANTCCSRGLTSSKYNERVGECQEAVLAMAEQSPHEGTHLRDFTLPELEACRKNMSGEAFRRARHVITEDIRTQQACEAMRAGDLDKLGELMNASDASLREDYEVTSPELDAMAAIARSLDGCYGARMTGAGFGGCTINLVARDKAEAFGAALMKGYTESMRLEGELIYSSPANGAGVVE